MGEPNPFWNRTSRLTVYPLIVGEPSGHTPCRQLPAVYPRYMGEHQVASRPRCLGAVYPLIVGEPTSPVSAGTQDRGVTPLRGGTVMVIDDLKRQNGLSPHRGGTCISQACSGMSEGLSPLRGGTSATSLPRLPRAIQFSKTSTHGFEPASPMMHDSFPGNKSFLRDPVPMAAGAGPAVKIPVINPDAVPVEPEAQTPVRTAYPDRWGRRELPPVDPPVLVD